MTWNWQQKGWPQWQYNKSDLIASEDIFLRDMGILMGVWKHLSEKERENLYVDTLGQEIVETSRIEHKYFDRDSVRRSLRNRIQQIDDKSTSKSEQAMAELMERCTQNLEEPFSHDMLQSWQYLLCKDDSSVNEVGIYRTDPEPMEVVSGPVGAERVHFVAVTTEAISSEMDQFITFLNQSSRSTPPLERAALAHVYFLAIHPFEDGNGRVARAISYRIIMQAIGETAYCSFSYMIGVYKREYYTQLEKTNTTLEITEWMQWFTDVILQSMTYSISKADLVITKTKLFDQYADTINARQEKIINRLFSAEPEGFEGGLSSKNYQTITSASSATATRDLRELVTMGVLVETGINKGKRYFLKKHKTDNSFVTVRIQ